MNKISGFLNPDSTCYPSVSMIPSSSGSPTTDWPFLTAHARILACILREPTVTIKAMAQVTGLTERYVQTLLLELRAAGYLSSEPAGRRKVYKVALDRKLRHPLECHRTIRDLAWFAGVEVAA